MGRPSPPKIQGYQIDQRIQSWSKDLLSLQKKKVIRTNPDTSQFNCE